jgi:cytoskeletal protein CcmA (bactofilin family)
MPTENDKERRMFGREDENEPADTSGNASILGAGSHFEGKIQVQGKLRVDGEFKGDVDCRETLEVGRSGVIHGNLNVKQAAIGGRIYGNINASDRIELKAGSHLEGDIVTRRLVIDEGVFFEGNCRMGEKTPGGPMASPRKQSEPESGELISP